MPARARYRVRPSEPSPRESRSSTASSMRMCAGGVSGMPLRTSQGESARGCSGSSAGFPQTYVPNSDAGSSSARPLGWASASQSAVSSQ
jgi:hypothetical protein